MDRHVREPERRDTWRAWRVLRTLRRARWRRVAAALWVGWALLPSMPFADTDETQVLAAFTLNFAKFTEWPADRLAAGHFTLCQLGGSERLASALQALQERTVQGLRIEFRRIDSGLEASRCMVLFAANLVPPPLPPGAAVLTIGDEPGFAQHGGMIGFVRDGARLRFEVNLGALKRADLMLSSHVLSLATNVIDSAISPPGSP